MDIYSVELSILLGHTRNLRMFQLPRTYQYGETVINGQFISIYTSVSVVSIYKNLENNDSWKGRYLLLVLAFTLTSKKPDLLVLQAFVEETSGCWKQYYPVGWLNQSFGQKHVEIRTLPSTRTTVSCQLVYPFQSIT